MQWSNFKEGVDILSKYIPDDAMFSVHAEHDQFWCGPRPVESVSMKDAARLEAMDWFIDEESWSCFV